MKVSLEILEQYLTDDRDELGVPGWISGASAEAYTAAYIAARQGGIEVLDLLIVASRCDRLTPFLIQRVLKREDIPAVHVLIDHISEKESSAVEHECVFMLKAWIVRQTIGLRT